MHAFVSPLKRCVGGTDGFFPTLQSVEHSIDSGKVKIAELHTSSSKLLEVGCFDPPAVGADITVAEIVSHDQNDIGLPGIRALRRILPTHIATGTPGFAAARQAQTSNDQDDEHDDKFVHHAHPSGLIQIGEDQARS